MNIVGNVDTGSAQTLVVTTMAVSGALLVVRAAQKSEPPPIRAGVGMLFAGVGLTTLAQFAPRVAAPMALLWLTSSVFVYGEPALRSIKTATAAPKTTSSGARPTTAA